MNKMKHFGCGVITGVTAGLLVPTIIKSCKSSQNQEKHAKKTEEHCKNDEIMKDVMNVSKSMKQEVGRLMDKMEKMQPTNKKSTRKKSST